MAQHFDGVIGSISFDIMSQLATWLSKMIIIYQALESASSFQ